MAGMSRLTKRLVLFVAASALLLNGALWLVSPPDYRDNVLRHTRDTLSLRAGRDSWRPMKLALEYLESGATEPIYSKMLLRDGIKFQYPPSALLLLQPVEWARRATGTTLPLLEMISLLFVAVMAATMFSIANRGLPPALSRQETVVRVGLAVFSTLTFYPFVKGYSLGQIQVWINAAFALFLWCRLTDRKVAAGVVLALPCLVKPQYGVLVLWALLKGERRLLTACAVTGTIGLVLSITQFGWANHIDYLDALSFMSGHGEAFYPNQSVNGLMNRLWSIEHPDLYNNLDWRDRYFPPYNRWVYGTTLTSSALLLIAAFFHPRARADTRGWCIVLLSATMASPIAWEHHYGILLPLYAILLPTILGNGAPRKTVVVLGATYVVTSNFFPAANLLAATPFNFLQSYLFVGALTVLLLLYDSRSEIGDRRIGESA